MPNAYLTGWITDARGRVRFVPANAIVTSSRDPLVLVFNQQGHFFVPNLESGKTYEFIARNGEVSKKISFTPKRGHNDLEITVRTKPARASKASTRKPLKVARQAGA